VKLGAEPRKLAVLAVLLLVAGYFLYTNISSDHPAPRASSPQPPASLTGMARMPELAGPVMRATPRTTSQQPSIQEFQPSLKPKKGAGFSDLNSVEASLRLDLLAKLQDVRLQGGDRSLFEFTAAPLPKTPEPKIIPKPVQTVAPPPPPPQVAERPPAPPIPLKFFGYTTAFRQGNRRAFFLDGDEILVASEGEVLKKRYRVVRISANSVVMEDLDYKAEQTLPLEPQVG
jgi:hypothetical protein